MKTCNKCGIEKDLDSFGNHKRMVDGKQRRCRACVKEINAKYYTKKLKFSRQELTAFKEERLKSIQDEINANEKEYNLIHYNYNSIRRGDIHKHLMKEGRIIKYDGMNGVKYSAHTWKGTFDLLFSAKRNKEEGRELDSGWDVRDMINDIYELDDKYECRSCRESKRVNEFGYFYDYDLDRETWDFLSEFFINNFKVLVRDYCDECESDECSNINKKRSNLNKRIESLKGMYKRERGVGRKIIRQRARWAEQKDKHTGKYNTNLSTGDDGRFLYIMKYKDLYKVGMSKDPYKRREGINNALKDKGVKLLYVGQPFEGRSVDNEGLIHKSLGEYREDVYWKTGSKSREFYRCDLDLIMSAMKEHCLLDSV